MQTKLIKAYNEKYFRNFQETDLKSLKQTPTEAEVKYLLSVVENYDNELFNLLEDLFEVMFGQMKYTFTPLSDVGMQVYANRKLMQTKFTSKFVPSQTAFEVGQILSGLSDESYFVGGCVRDPLLGKNPKDIDFCTDTPVSVLSRVFKEEGFKVDEVGLQFLVLVVSKDGEQFEVANFRKDRDNAGGEPGTMEEDALRRDFTVNTGYVRVRDHKLFDPNGQFVDDLMSMTLRFVGKPKDRLDEDPIRASRFYRFLTRGFKPEKNSLQAVRTRLQHDSKRVTQLQNVLSLPGVAEAIEAERSKTTSKLGANMQPKVTMSVEELSKDLLSIERMRLEIEKMAGL